MYAGLPCSRCPRSRGPALARGHMLREHRGDGHVAALVSERIGGTEAHVLSALASGIYPAESFGRIHHLPKARLAEVMDGLRGRVLLMPPAASPTPGVRRRAGSSSLTDPSRKLLRRTAAARADADRLARAHRQQARGHGVERAGCRLTAGGREGDP